MFIYLKTRIRFPRIITSTQIFHDINNILDVDVKVILCGLCVFSHTNMIKFNTYSYKFRTLYNFCSKRRMMINLFQSQDIIIRLNYL
jgi:hypothetical protein